jgi:hypothetical protein
MNLLASTRKNRLHGRLAAAAAAGDGAVAAAAAAAAAVCHGIAKLLLLPQEAH